MVTMLALRIDSCCLRHELCIGEDGEEGAVWGEHAAVEPGIVSRTEQYYLELL
jgi:hypothetical protein